MAFRLTIEPEATAEFRDAISWYEQQEPGLGRRFSQAVDHTMKRITAMPLTFPVVFADRVRRARMTPPFPYSIFFLLEGERVIVIAIFHGRRDPEAWRNPLE